MWKGSAYVSGLENLTEKILQDASSQAEQIAADAKAQARQIIDDAVAEAEREKSRILQEAAAEAAHTAEQIALGKALEIRDANLAARQQTLEKVFGLALERLNDLPKDAYWKFVADYLEKVDIDGETIFFPKKYGITSVEELNGHLKKAGKAGNLSLGEDSRDISGGFVLVRDGVEQNNTFEAVVNFRRYMLESEVLKILD